MRVAICDDDGKDLMNLHRLLKAYDPQIEVILFSTAGELYDHGGEEAFDAVILDIEMEAPNGYEIALRLARWEAHPIILFATNSAAYAVRGYGLALRYLLKPLTQEALNEAMDAVNQELRRSRLTVTLNGVSHVLKVHDIRYAEVVGHCTTLYTQSGSVPCRGTMKELSAQLPGRWFAAPHQSYVVNLLHVRSVSSQEVCLTDGTRIPVSRRKQREFMESFHRFLGV